MVDLCNITSMRKTSRLKVYVHCSIDTSHRIMYALDTSEIDCLKFRYPYASKVMQA